MAGLAFAAVLCVLLWESLFCGKVLSQADALNLFEPWASVAPKGFVAANELLLDQATGFLPWLQFQAAELRKGELPLWNPYCYCGEPFGSLYQTALFSPFNWIYYAVPSWHTHAWIAFLKFWLAAQFTFVFLRRLGLVPAAAAIGGLGFMLCGFMVAWLGFNHTSVALYLPALLWSIERVAARPNGREGALFAVLVGLQALAGHIQTTVLLFLATSTWVLVRSGLALGSRRLSLRGLAWLLAGAALGLALSTPQLLPFLEFLPRTQASAVFVRDDLVASEGVPAAAIMMIDPFHFGAPHTHDYRGPLGPNLNFNELIGGYVGRTVLALALLQVVWLGWRSRRFALTALFLLVAAVGGLVAYQIDPLYGALHTFPVLASTKLMRFSLFLAFGLAGLAALAMDALLRCAPRRLGYGLALAAFGLVGAEQITFARGYNPEVMAETLVQKTPVTDFLAKQATTERVLGVHNTFLRPNANMFYRVPMISGYNSMEDRRFTELLLHATRGTPRFPFISEITAFDRIEALPLLSLLGAKWVLSTVPLPPPFRQALAGNLSVYENPGALPRAFLAKGVRIVAAPAERVELMSSPSFDPYVAILERDSESARQLLGETPASPPADGTVAIVEYEPRSIEVRVTSARKALLVLTDVWDPGWSAEVRAATTPREPGREVPIERVDHALRGIFVEPGDWSLRFTYRPLPVRVGIALALLAGLALGVIIFYPRRSHASAA